MATPVNGCPCGCGADAEARCWYTSDWEDDDYEPAEAEPACPTCGRPVAEEDRDYVCQRCEDAADAFDAWFYRSFE